MKVLVTGGAGYIGGFMVKYLLDRGDEVIVIDSLEKGNEEYLDERARFIKGNLLDKNFVSEIFSDNKFDGVIHFTGYISMGESMQNPYIYFENNVIASLNVIEQICKSGSSNFIFSSTAGVYGNPQATPIPEDHPKNPTNPYGESKLMVEKILGWYRKIFNLNYAALRYFNACGAALDGSLGEMHDPETHIIPNAINALLSDSEFKLFGTDYDTFDGTCVRDYIHVLDLVEAHALALEKLIKDGGELVYNIGTGNGFSNKQVLKMVEKVGGKKLQINIEERRPGDANVLIADASKIKNELGFFPKYSDLETIIKTAFEWHSRSSKLIRQLTDQN